MYDPSLRRLGYLVRVGRPSPILGMLGRAELRPRPLNRAFPGSGHWVADCPTCGRADALFVEPDRSSWSTSCGCVRGEAGAFELFAILMAEA
jgi:hypothetical protein